MKTRTGSGWYRRSGWLTIGALLIAACVAMWPARFGGGTTYVTTHGISMQPRFHTGDLAILRHTGDYRVGDVAGYRSTTFHTVVMHRIVAIHHGRYTFKGDNNSWLDPERPSRSQLVGALAIRIPQGGIWLHRLINPGALGLLAFILLAAGTTGQSRRHRRKRDRMSRHASPRRQSTVAVGALPAAVRAGGAVTAVVGVLALGLAAAAWTRPVDTLTAATPSPAATMTFTYTATVPKTAAYDGTIVTSPDPIFRRLTREVDVHFAYRGRPGTVTVAARLSTPSGWHSTIPLGHPTHFTDTRYDGSVRLHLPALDVRARAAATITGVPAGPLTVTVTPTVRTSTGVFTPTLPLTLTPLELTLTGDPKTLTVSDDTASSKPFRAARTLTLIGYRITVATARTVSLAGVLVALLAVALLTLLNRPTDSAIDPTSIRRRYASLLVPVGPTPAPPGRPVVDVTNFRTLVRVADRYGLFILHWSRSSIDTYLVHDDATTYRYRAGTGIMDEPASIQTQHGDTVGDRVNAG